MINSAQNLTILKKLSVLSLLWLMIPFLLFTLTFYKFYLFAATVFVVWYFFKNTFMSFFSTPIEPCTWNMRYYIPPAIIIAILFTWLSGVMPPFSSNFDWIKHFAILNMLTSHSWPPLFTDHDHTYFLRYNLGLYIVPALLGKLTPFMPVRYWMAFYEIVGLTLACLLMTYTINADHPKGSRLVVKNLLIITIFMGFSGWDIIGSVLQGKRIDSLTHIEWWFDFISFSSIATQQFWVPQHGLPGWIGTLLLFTNHRYKGELLKESIFILFPLIFFWSPLVLIGILLLFPLYIVEIFKLLKSPKNLFMSFIILVVIVLPTSIYFNTEIAKMPHHFVWDPLHPTMEIVKRIFLFLFLEGFIYISFLLYLIKDNGIRLMLLFMAIALFASTVYEFGYVNDFSLKVSMPSITLMAFLIAYTFTTHLNSIRHIAARILLALAYCVGLFTPFHEIGRAVTEDFNPFLITFEEGIWGYEQYFAPIESKPFFIKSIPIHEQHK